MSEEIIKRKRGRPKKIEQPVVTKEAQEDSVPKQAPVSSIETEVNPVTLLSKDLSMRIKQLNAENKMCVVDRINSFDFVDVFRDAINSYRQDVVICERLFFKDKCTNVKRPVYNITDDAKEVYSEFIKFTEENLNGNTEVSDEIAQKLNEYQDKLQNVSPDIQEVDTLIYKSGYNGDGYLMIPLDEIPDESLKEMTTMIARFVLSYFLTLKFVISENYVINVFPVNYDDHIDITAMFTIK